MYKIIALIGEAGCGKDTILQDILKKLPSDFNETLTSFKGSKVLPS